MRKRTMAAIALLGGLMLIGGSASTAGAEAPADETAEATAAAVPTNPGIRLVNVEQRYDWDTDRNCAATGSRNSETDIVMWDGCNRDGAAWDINFLRRNSAGTPLYEIKHPYSGLCLSLEGVESGHPPSEADAQLEPCERQHDAVWWFRDNGNGQVLVRPYLKNSAGRYPCLEADAGDLAGDVTVQVYDCPSSNMREWVLNNSWS
jgi:hypothetical protein